MIGNHIRMIREEKKMTQAELSIKAGLDKDVLCKIENNRRHVQEDEEERIAKALEVSIDALHNNPMHVNAYNNTLNDNSVLNVNVQTLIQDNKDYVSKIEAAFKLALAAQDETIATQKILIENLLNQIEHLKK